MTDPLDPDGPAAPPRSNGELVFAEPWESRAFGLVVTLFKTGAFGWPQFQTALIARIAAWGEGSERTTDWSYYEHWLGALEDVLASQGALSVDEVTARAHTLARRPRGHDHATAPHGHDRATSSRPTLQTTARPSHQEQPPPLRRDDGRVRPARPKPGLAGMSNQGSQGCEVPPRTGP